MLKSKWVLVITVFLALFMVGCDSDLARVELETDAGLVDVGDEISLTVVGYSSFNTRMDLEEKAEWTASSGTVVADGYQAVFTPSEEGLATVKVTVGDFSSEISFNVGEKILAVASLDFTDQGGGEVQPQYERTFPCFSHWNNEGHWLEWEFEVEKAAYYTPIIMYSTAARFDVFRSVSVDGELVIESVEFPLTGGFGNAPDEWDTLALEPLYLEAGVRTIRIENIVPEVETGMNPAWIALVTPEEVVTAPDTVDRIHKILGL